jgi:hypothetical protein
LNKFGEVNYIGKKLRIALERKNNFSRFTCTSHFLEIKTKLLDTAINLIIYKKLQDVRREFERKNRQRHVRKKMGIFQNMYLIVVGSSF